MVNLAPSRTTLDAIVGTSAGRRYVLVTRPSASMASVLAATAASEAGDVGCGGVVWP